MTGKAPQDRIAAAEAAEARLREVTREAHEAVQAARQVIREAQEAQRALVERETAGLARMIGRIRERERQELTQAYAQMMTEFARQTAGLLDGIAALGGHETWDQFCHTIAGLLVARMKPPPKGTPPPRSLQWDVLFHGPLAAGDYDGVTLIPATLRRRDKPAGER